MLCQNCQPCFLQRVVSAYAHRLLARLPKTASGLTTGTPTAHTTDWYVKLAEDDFAVAAVIIATAEYCGEVVAALARNVAKLLEPPLGDQVGAYRNQSSGQYGPGLGIGVSITIHDDDSKMTWYTVGRDPIP